MHAALSRMHIAIAGRLGAARHSARLAPGRAQMQLVRRRALAQSRLMLPRLRSEVSRISRTKSARKGLAAKPGVLTA
jgi:hypothetical protein